MSFARGMLGLGKLGWLFVVGAYFVVACGGSSDGDGDESDNGSGGTSTSGGTGGVLGRGGAMSTGGTSSLSSQCAIFCQRTAACPGTEPCQENCLSSADAAASLGCSTAYRRALDCLATVADPCADLTDSAAHIGGDRADLPGVVVRSLAHDVEGFEPGRIQRYSGHRHERELTAASSTAPATEP